MKKYFIYVLYKNITNMHKDFQILNFVYRNYKSIIK